MQKFTVATVQETHGNLVDLEFFRTTFLDYVVEGCFLPSNAGGILVVVQRQFFEQFLIWEDVALLLGQCLIIDVEGRLGQLILVSIHIELNASAVDQEKLLLEVRSALPSLCKSPGYHLG